MLMPFLKLDLQLLFREIVLVHSCSTTFVDPQEYLTYDVLYFFSVLSAGNAGNP